MRQGGGRERDACVGLERDIICQCSAVEREIHFHWRRVNY